MENFKFSKTNSLKSETKNFKNPQRSFVKTIRRKIQDMSENF